MTSSNMTLLSILVSVVFAGELAELRSSMLKSYVHSQWNLFGPLQETQKRFPTFVVAMFGSGVYSSTEHHWHLNHW